MMSIPCDTEVYLDEPQVGVPSKAPGQRGPRPRHEQVVNGLRPVKVNHVANHATGPLDGLILLHLIGSVRKDVKIVLTDLLAGLDNLSELFLVYDQYASRLQKQNIQAIRQAIRAEQAVIFFPAGEVTKLTRRGLREQTWQTGPVALARKYGAPILPVALHARNSWLYYLVALLHRNLSTMMLSHEMFRKRSRTIPVTIGELLPATRLTAAESDVHVQSQQLREYMHQLLGPHTFC